MALAISLATLIPTAITGLAGNQISATINVVPPAVKSVTVSVTDVVYANCAGGSSTGTQLGFPKGDCQTSTYTVTNGNTAAQIDVNGADAVPSSLGTHWMLCGVGVTCTGPSLSPGQDQYLESVTNPSTTNRWVMTFDNSPRCDGAFWNSNTSCGTSAANTSTSEFLSIFGPSASTDGSSTFTTTVTYTAV